MPKTKDVNDALYLDIRVTAEEKARFTEAAKLASRTLSDWLRVVAKEAAAKSRGGT